MDDRRRPDIAALDDALIRTHAPKLEPVIMGGMLGYRPCVRFKRLEDLEEESLVALIEETARMGLGA